MAIKLRRLDRHEAALKMPSGHDGGINAIVQIEGLLSQPDKYGIVIQFKTLLGHTADSARRFRRPLALAAPARTGLAVGFYRSDRLI